MPGNHSKTHKNNTGANHAGGGKGSKSKSKSRSKSGSKSKKSKSKMGANMCYCVKCKKGTIPSNMVEKTTKNGRCMMSGTCSKCGTKVNKFCKSK